MWLTIRILSLHLISFSIAGLSSYIPSFSEYFYTAGIWSRANGDKQICAAVSAVGCKWILWWLLFLFSEYCTCSLRHTTSACSRRVGLGGRRPRRQAQRSPELGKWESPLRACAPVYLLYGAQRPAYRRRLRRRQLLLLRLPWVTWSVSRATTMAWMSRCSSRRWWRRASTLWGWRRAVKTDGFIAKFYS